MKTYNSFEEIDYDLKRLKLERQIGFEQLKVVKGEFTENFRPMNWVNSFISIASKYGIFVLLKKIFR